jgi:transposase-like protein
MAMKVDHLDELAKDLVKQYKTKEALFGEKGLVKELQKRLLQAALDGELTEHLGYEKHERSPLKDNARNGYSNKTVKGSEGELELKVPRDREGTFEPQIVAKRQTRFDGFDDKIIAMYARGLSVEDIQQQLQELYGVDVSSSLISNVTATIIDDVKAWQSRPLDALYPIVYLDCIVVKIREDKRIINKAVYLALGVNLEGQKELLGMWVSQNEGAKFWLSVLTELKNRGLEDIFIACVDGLTGFPEAIASVYRETKIQLCIVHMVRNSLKYVSYKDRKALVEDLKAIYKAKTLEEAELALSSFSNKWDAKYPSISQSWLRNWENVTPFFAYPADVRKAIYTTNAIESMNMTLRKVIKNKRVFPTDESVFKLLYLAINNVSKKWTMPIRNWKEAMNWFIIEFGDRVVNDVR